MSHFTSPDPYAFLLASAHVDPVVSAFVRATLEDGRNESFFSAVRDFAEALTGHGVSAPAIVSTLQDMLAAGHRRLHGSGVPAQRRAKAVRLARQAVAVAERAIAHSYPVEPPPRHSDAGMEARVA